MANIRNLKRRIKTAKNIAQTTKAMEMVAASRMKKAQLQALEGRPYSENLLMITQRLLGRVKIKEGTKLEKYFSKINDENKKTAMIIITPDKGLCGALVSNFAKYILRFIRAEGKTILDYDFIIIGKKGKDAILRLNGNIIAQFDSGMTQPKYETVPPIVLLFNQAYQNNQYSKILLVYTHFINTLSQQPKIIQLLPFLGFLQEEKEQLQNQENINLSEYLFEPDPENVLTNLLPHYLENELYHARLEAYASEQSARMTAMKNATDNAKDIIGELTLFYNKERQQVITSEIADIATATLSISK